PDFQVGAGGNPTDPPFPGNIGNVTQDLFFQTLGLRRAAVASFNAMSPSVQSALQSYADGVNEVIARMNVTATLPAEYALLNVAASKTVMLASTATEGNAPIVSAVRAADAGGRVARLSAQVSASSPRRSRGTSPRRPAAAQRRAIAAARKATFTKAREYIAQL